MKTVIKLVLASLFFGGSVANAALVDFSLIGLVDRTLDPFDTPSTDPNAYGLSVGDTISADGVYEDGGLNGSGAETVLLNVGSNFLEMEVGDASFSQLDDASPMLMLFDGVVVGLNFQSAFDANGTFTSNDFYFWGDDNNGYQIDGYWSANPVPVPAAVWLFGSGLLGLVGVARRKAA